MLHAFNQNNQKKSLCIIALAAIVLASIFAVPASVVPAQNKPVKDNGGAGITVKVAVCPQNPPYQFLNERGGLVGINVDILNFIAAECNYTLEYSCCESDSACLTAIEKGDADIALGCKSILKNNDRYYMSRDLSSSSISVVAKKSVVPFIEETNRTLPFSIIYEYQSVDMSLLYSLGFEHLICTNSQENAIKYLLDNKAEIFIGNDESITYMLKELGCSNDYTTLHSMISRTNYAIFVSKSASSLYRNINRALGEIRVSNKYEEICENWLVDASEIHFAKIIRYFAAAGAGFLCVVLFLSINARILSREVHKKTNELLRTNASLKQSMLNLQRETMFRNDLLDYLPIGAVLFNSNYRIIFMNPAACSLLKLSYVEADCLDIREMPVFGQIFKENERELFFKKFPRDSRIIKIFVNGEEQKFRYRISQKVNETKLDEVCIIDEILMTVENVTEEELRRQKLFTIEKAATLNQVTAGIAHEIKNPLMAIRVSASLVEEQWESEEIRQAFSKFIPDEIDKINTLVESLINYAKPPSEDFCAVEIVDLLKNSIYLASITHKKSKHAIKFSISTNSNPKVYIQKDLFRQTLSNLLINAVWAIDAKAEKHPPNWDGEISGRIEADDKWVDILISDNGIGMSEQALTKCTEPFFTTKLSGTGMGLALVKQCVENSGGRLFIKSQEHEYTQVTIRLSRYHSSGS